MKPTSLGASVWLERRARRRAAVPTAISDAPAIAAKIQRRRFVTLSDTIPTTLRMAAFTDIPDDGTGGLMRLAYERRHDPNDVAGRR
jgi:hypothetical protein